MAFSDGIADFRSDTVTRPTEAMFEAMASAPLGDDVYGEDQTVNALQAESAALFGMEAGLFVASGIMGNQIALNVHTSPGQEVICVDQAHIRNFESGGGAVTSGLQFRTVQTTGGIITAPDVSRLVEQSSYHLPDIGILTWENTHNSSGGTVVPLEVMAETGEVAREAGITVHLDGARIFNAAASSGVALDAYGDVVDSVQFCFSKSLGAPIGSMLCGTADFIAKARKVRSRFGGGMRQVGVIAAAASIALEHRHSLVKDHDLANHLATGLAALFPAAVDADAVQTNMVMVDTTDLPGGDSVIIDKLAAEGVLVACLTPGVLRFVTHRDVNRADADRVIELFESL